MKKKYIKPEMLVHQIQYRGILLGSKGVYGKITGVDADKAALKYGAYVIDEDDEDNFDPD